MPISFKLLLKLVCSLPHIWQSSYETKLFVSAFSLAFFSLLRVGIFTAETKSTPGTHVIGFHDILIQNNAGVEELHLKIVVLKLIKLVIPQHLLYVSKLILQFARLD